MNFSEYNAYNFESIKRDFLKNPHKYDKPIEQLSNNDAIIIKPIDMIRIDSYSVPILHAITIENVLFFSKYSKENADYVQAVINNNIKLVEMYVANWELHILENLKIFIKLGDDNLNKLFNVYSLDNDPSQIYNSSTSPLKMHVPETILAYGGGYQDFQAHVQQFIRFIMYYFPIVVSDGALKSICAKPTMANTQCGGSSSKGANPLSGGSTEGNPLSGGSTEGNPLSGGIGEMNTVKNITGNKRLHRLVYIISLNLDDKISQYIIKITRRADQYKREIENYHNINNFVDLLKLHKKYAPSVIKLYSPWKDTEDSSYIIKENNTIISFINYAKQYDIELPNDISRLIRSRIAIITPFENFDERREKIVYYMITEYDPMYTPGVKSLLPNSDYDAKINMYLRIAHDLKILNDGIGFVHWDLHDDNILFNSNGCVKYYDFDMSDTLLLTDTNNLLFDGAKNYKMATIQNTSNFFVFKETLDIKENIQYRIKTGYIYDLLRIYQFIISATKEEDLINFNQSVQKFILNWDKELHNKSAEHIFNRMTDYVIESVKSMDDIVKGIELEYNVKNEKFKCMMIAQFLYTKIFDNTIDHPKKSAIYQAVKHDIDETKLSVPNNEYIRSHLAKVLNIINAQNYNDASLNDANKIAQQLNDVCIFSPSFEEYNIWIEHLVVLLSTNKIVTQSANASQSQTGNGYFFKKYFKNKHEYISISQKIH